MRILTEKEFMQNKEYFLREIKKGAIFIYPTDTIYGIGCNAMLDFPVARLREIKERKEMPFSVLSPSKEWITSNFIIPEAAGPWLEKLPGPYTLIIKQKKACVSPFVNPGKDTLGVRMPNHWFSGIAEELSIPLVTTSANKSGDAYMTSLEDLDPAIKAKVDFIIYEGEKKGSPSTLVMLDKNTVETKER